MDESSSYPRFYEWVSDEVPKIAFKFDALDRVVEMRQQISISSTKDGEKLFVCRHYGKKERVYMESNSAADGRSIFMYEILFLGLRLRPPLSEF